MRLACPSSELRQEGTAAGGFLLQLHNWASGCGGKWKDKTNPEEKRSTCIQNGEALPILRKAGALVIFGYYDRLSEIINLEEKKSYSFSCGSGDSTPKSESSLLWPLEEMQLWWEV